jgi:glucose/arabinose dehydrogenase
MLNAVLRTVLAGCALTLTACRGTPLPDAPPNLACDPTLGTTIGLREIAKTADFPILATSPPGDPRLFIVERTGVISVAQSDVPPTTFLDLFDTIAIAGDEQGLLGLAFHPAYATNRRFFVYYTTSTANIVAEYAVSASDPNRADPASGTIILSIPDFAANHNGGMIELGADGYLYISTGDGGGGGDPQETAQNLDSRLGKILRIDIDQPSGGRAYGIPVGNPFPSGGAPEVFMYGFRNPWRWSFDRATGDIYIGDVGQERIEEVSVVAAATAAGANFGWDDCEGHLDYEGTGCAAGGNRVLPAYEEIRPAGGGTSNWTSVIGGQVYRGSCFPDLVGRYFFTDNNAGGLYSFVWNGSAATDVVAHAGDFPGGPTFIHEGPGGELYIGHSNGRTSQIVAR